MVRQVDDPRHQPGGGDSGGPPRKTTQPVDDVAPPPEDGQTGYPPDDTGGGKDPYEPYEYPEEPPEGGGTGEPDEVSILAATLEGTGSYDSARAREIAQQMLNNAGGSYKGGAGAPQAAMPDDIDYHDPIDASDQYLDQLTFEDTLASGIGIGNTEVTTREVEDDELVEERLEGLLSGDSRYLRNARMRAMEQAQARGQFGSSFASGAAERAAIEAAMPIATADAQAFRDAASQNMNALNSFALAHLNRATQLETSLLSANTQRAMANLDAGIRTSIANLDAMTKVDIANLDADTRTRLANVQAATQVRVQDMVNKAQIYMQGKQMSHETGLEQLRQEGRVELATMDAQLRERLAKFELDGQIQLNMMDHEQQKEINSIVQGYELEQKQEQHRLDRQTEHANLAMQASMNYTNYVTAYANTDMDSTAAKRLAEEAWNKYEAEISMVNSLYPEQEPIVAERTTVSVGSGNAPGKKKK